MRIYSKLNRYLKIIIFLVLAIVYAGNAEAVRISTPVGSVLNILASLPGYVTGYFNLYMQSGSGWLSTAYYNIGGYYSFNAYVLGQTGALPTNLSDQGANEQAALMDANIVQLKMANGQDFSDTQLANKKLRFVNEVGNYKTFSTIFIPSGLHVENHANWNGQYNSTATAPCNNTAGYTDGTDCHNLSQANVGKNMPVFVVNQGAEVDGLSVDPTDGTTKGDAIAFDAMEEIGDCTIVTPGTGYTGTDHPLINFPDKFAGSATLNITVSGGIPQTCAPNSGVRWNKLNGIIPLAKALRAVQWAKQAFINATGITTFDGSGGYITSGGTGTGLSVSFNVVPPYCRGSSGTGYINCSAASNYEGLFSSTAQQTAIYHSKIHVTNAGTTCGDATYGDQYAVLFAGQNQTVDNAFVQGGCHGWWETAAATDNKFYSIYGFANVTCFTHAGTNDAWIDPTCDTPSATVFDLQKGTGIVLGGKTYVNSSGTTLTSNAFKFGSAAALWGPFEFNFTGEATGSGSTPFISFDYAGNGNKIDISVNNSQTNTTTHYITFGTHNTTNSSSRLSGAMDGVTAANFCVNPANAAGLGIRFWDGSDQEWLSYECIPAGNVTVSYVAHGTQTFVDPPGVFYVIACGRGGTGSGAGGGSGGGGSTATAAFGAGAGGSGGSTYKSCQYLPVTPGTSYTLTIGTGGAAVGGGAQAAANAAGASGNPGTAGNGGTSTTFGSLWTWLGTGGGGAGGAGTFSAAGSGGFGGTSAGLTSSGGGGNGGATNTAGSSGQQPFASSPYASSSNAGAGGGAGGVGGGGGGGGNGQLVGGDFGGTIPAAVSGGNGGATGNNGAQGSACNPSSLGYGGQGGVGGGGGGLKASTGSQGGAGQGGCAGNDGELEVTYVLP